jgi:hypothetical protein
MLAIQCLLHQLICSKLDARTGQAAHLQNMKEVIRSQRAEWANGELRGCYVGSVVSERQWCGKQSYSRCLSTPHENSHECLLEPRSSANNNKHRCERQYDCFLHSVVLTFVQCQVFLYTLSAPPAPLFCILRRTVSPGYITAAGYGRAVGVCSYVAIGSGTRSKGASSCTHPSAQLGRQGRRSASATRGYRDSRGCCAVKARMLSST